MYSYLSNPSFQAMRAGRAAGSIRRGTSFFGVVLTMVVGTAILPRVLGFVAGLPRHQVSRVIAASIASAGPRVYEEGQVHELGATSVL